MIYFRQNQPQRAIESFQRALAVHPTMVEALQNYSAILLRAGDFAGAVPILVQLVSLRPNNYDARIAYGTALRHIDQPSSALQQYEIAREIAPDRADVFYNLAVLYNYSLSGSLTELRRAAQFYQQYLTRSTNSGDERERRLLAERALVQLGTLRIRPVTPREIINGMLRRVLRSPLRWR